jgi:hypothetical protein
MSATPEDLALLGEYVAAREEYERLISKFGPAHTPGQDWPAVVYQAGDRVDALKDAAGEPQPGDPLCCQRYGRLHLPEFALQGCRWYGARPALVQAEQAEDDAEDIADWEGDGGHA